MEKLLVLRYPPYAGKLAKIRQTSELTPNFDREGNEVRGVKYWLGFILSLGGDGPKNVAKRWAVALILAVGANKAGNNGRLPSYIK
jgi:beta-apo-4'-carotenal oxygenase